MNVDIARLAITLQGFPAGIGERLTEQLDDALQRRLSDLQPATLGSGLATLDLGVIDAPAHADAQTLCELIATRLGEWVTHAYGPASAQAEAAEGR